MLFFLLFSIVSFLVFHTSSSSLNANINAINVGPDDGNPHHWDRERRCDSDYKPFCRPCEGRGGIAYGDNNADIHKAKCAVIKTPEQIDEQTLIKPKWGNNFELTNGYHEILIGKKNDPLCFVVFPRPTSHGTQCYRAEEGTAYYDFQEKSSHSFQLDLNMKISGFLHNITSTVLHQDVNMWITNHIWFNIDVCVCIKNNGLYPIQPEWTKDAIYVGRENIHVEYIWRDQILDHWVIGPHHLWSDTKTGDIVRLWQPWNGLEVLDLATKKNFTSSIQIPPPVCKRGGSHIRINCNDDGMPIKCNGVDCENNTDDQPTLNDMKRATRIIQSSKSKNFTHNHQKINAILHNTYGCDRVCSSWTVDELHRVQLALLYRAHTHFNTLYLHHEDERKIRYESMRIFFNEWNKLRNLPHKSPYLLNMYRDGLCAETVMWFLHHLTESSRYSFDEDIPLLPQQNHYHFHRQCSAIIQYDDDDDDDDDGIHTSSSIEKQICINYKKQMAYLAYDTMSLLPFGVKEAVVAEIM